MSLMLSKTHNFPCDSNSVISYENKTLVNTQGNRVFRCRRPSDFGGKKKETWSHRVCIYLFLFRIHQLHETKKKKKKKKKKKQVGRLYIERFEYGMR